MTLMKRSNVLPGIPSFFDDFFTRDLWDWSLVNSAATGTSLPAVNIVENDNEFQVEVAAPGMSKEDFQIEVDNNVLTISSEKEHSEEEKDEKGKYSRQEFMYAAFKRSFTIPEDQVNVEKIKADYKDGLLHIHLPKKEEVKPKPVKTIKIS